MKHFKKLRAAAILLCSLTLLSVLPACNSFSDTEYAVVSEGNISADGFIFDKYENSTVRITGLDSSPRTLEIPEEIEGMPVVEIAECAFENNDKLLYLKLPKGNIKLGKRFCSGCVALMVVDLSGSVTALPASAFEGCVNLSVVYGMSSVTEIGDQVFADCTSLASFKTPADLQSIGAESFRGCTSLASIELPETLTSIGESAFWGCSSLAVAIINGNASLPRYAFLNCISLSEIVLGDNVEAIGEEAFRGCSALYTFRAGKNFKTVADYAFHGCDKLTEISFAGDTGKITVGDGNEALGISK